MLKFFKRMLDFIKRIVGTKNEREIRRIRPYVDQINSLGPEYEKLSDGELRAKTEQFKKRFQEATAQLRDALEAARAEASTADIERREELKTQIEESDKELRETEARVLEELIPEAFAAVREASKRTIGLRHFDVQLIENRRGKDLGGDVALVFELTDWARDAFDHRQRLPGPPRRSVDGTDLP